MADAPTDQELAAMSAIFISRLKRERSSKAWAQTLVVVLKKKGLATEVSGRPGTLDLTPRGRQYVTGRAA